jgi:hypothetical protein
LIGIHSGYETLLLFFVHVVKTLKQQSGSIAGQPACHCKVVAACQLPVQWCNFIVVQLATILTGDSAQTRLPPQSLLD